MYELCCILLCTARLVRRCAALVAVRVCFLTRTHRRLCGVCAGKKNYDASLLGSMERTRVASLAALPSPPGTAAARTPTPTPTPCMADSPAVCSGSGGDSSSSSGTCTTVTRHTLWCLHASCVTSLQHFATHAGVEQHARSVHYSS